MNTQQLWPLAQDLLKKGVGCRKEEGREGGREGTEVGRGLCGKEGVGTS